MLFRISRDEGELIVATLEDNLDSGQPEYLQLVHICDAIRKGFGMICHRCSLSPTGHPKPTSCVVCVVEFAKISEESE